MIIESDIDRALEQISRNNPTPSIKQLISFERVHLKVNETSEVFFPF
jgi:hypothetical protein